MFPNDFFENGPVIGVIGGRFLPIIELSVTKDIDADRVNSPSFLQSQKVVVKSEQYDITLTTNRKPAAQTPVCRTSYIVGKEHQIVLEDVVETGHSVVSEDWDNQYEVEMTFMSFELQKC